MRRRTFAKVVGTGITGLALSTTASASGNDGDPPNENVSVTRVNPFSTSQTVPAGNWITHYTGWVDAEGSDYTKEDVQRWLDAMEFAYYIDGEPVADPMTHWNEIEPYSYEGNDSYAVFWEYTTPPKSPGNYTVRLVQSYPDGFYDSGTTVREPGTVEEFTGAYQVVPGARKKP